MPPQASVVPPTQQYGNVDNSETGSTTGKTVAPSGVPASGALPGTAKPETGNQTPIGGGVPTASSVASATNLNQVVRPVQSSQMHGVMTSTPDRELVGQPQTLQPVVPPVGSTAPGPPYQGFV